MKTIIALTGFSPASANAVNYAELDSISFNPDALLKGIENINNAEAKPPSILKEYSM